MALVDCKPEDFRISPFAMIGSEWMLIAAEKEGRTNAMTASWGGLGVMWHKNVAFIVIRPHRFTKEFVDAADTFSLNFFLDAKRRDTLNYFGTVSGRDEDKVAKAGLTVAHADGAPYFAESRAVVLCRKLYAQPYEERFFIDSASDKKCYPDKDYHTLYIGEVLRILADKDAF